MSIRIDRNNVKPKLCPLCGSKIGAFPLLVEIKLNDGTIMPQPICEADKANMEQKKYQIEMLKVAKFIWVDEIYDNKEMSLVQKDKEIDRIMDLKVL